MGYRLSWVIVGVSCWLLLFTVGYGWSLLVTVAYYWLLLVLVVVVVVVVVGSWLLVVGYCWLLLVIYFSLDPYGPLWCNLE